MIAPTLTISDSEFLFGPTSGSRSSSESDARSKIVTLRQEIHIFKFLLARRYRSIYRKLITNLTTGAVLHADETEVRLRSGKSYVWVFASFEEVVFVRRPTREGNYLRELLGKFGGVLITDFYGAYEPPRDCRRPFGLSHAAMSNTSI